MNLGVVHRSDDANAAYRAMYPMMALRERGHDVVHVEQRYREPIEIGPLARCELVHFHRPLVLYDDGAAVARLLEAGIAVSFDEDDNIAEAPRELIEMNGQDWLPRLRQNFELVLEHVPRVALCTTPSELLATRFQDAGCEDVRVIDNYLPGQFMRVEERGHYGIVIGWHAGREHGLDVDALELAPMLRRVLDAHPEARVVTVGLDLGLDHERYSYEEGVDLELLTQRLADFDIGLVPLADIPFNQGRSNVKAREYAAAGVPWLASPVGSYRELGKDHGGELVADDAWFDALGELIRSPAQRAKMRRRGLKWAKRETIWRMSSLWEQAFLDAIDAARAAA